MRELDGKKQKGAEGGPEFVGTVTDGVAESEVFPEGENGDDGGSDGDDGCGGEKDDADDDRNKNQGGGDAFPSHEEEGYQISIIRSQHGDQRSATDDWGPKRMQRHRDIGTREREIETFDPKSPNLEEETSLASLGVRGWGLGGGRMERWCSKVEFW